MSCDAHVQCLSFCMCFVGVVVVCLFGWLVGFGVFCWWRLRWWGYVLGGRVWFVWLVDCVFFVLLCSALLCFAWFGLVWFGLWVVCFALFCCLFSCLFLCFACGCCGCCCCCCCTYVCFASFVCSFCSLMVFVVVAGSGGLLLFLVCLYVCMLLFLCLFSSDMYLLLLVCVPRLRQILNTFS